MVNDTDIVQYWNGSSVNADGAIHRTFKASHINYSTDMNDYKIIWLDNNNNSILDSGDYLNLDKPTRPGEYRIQFFYNDEMIYSRRVEVEL